ncbi:NEW3 domain-containing protein [Kribbella amoyensis]|uniref:NEW3 domain-containing protein n=1 Tax=Kribbella amoyensis TaxID=996641 RepID=UPI0011A70DE7|nr:NEW3 domain-containing protein [Kribbella amoyensis]
MALIEGIPGEFGPQPWGEAIQRGCELLLRVTRRPANHEVRLPGLATTPRHVIEERTGRALTWRRDGDDLVVRLPGSESPAGGAQVVQVALQGKLRIVPPDTSTANADGVWDLEPAGSTAHLVARRTADVAVRLFGAADPATQYRVKLANRSYAVPGGELIGTTIGPFPVRAGRVVRLTLGNAAVRRILVAPVGTVLASIDPVDADRIRVHVTNFGRVAAQGEVFLPMPPEWSADTDAWSFEGLEAGATVSRTVEVAGPSEGPRGPKVLQVRLDAGRRSASLPLDLGSTVASTVGD